MTGKIRSWQGQALVPEHLAGTLSHSLWRTLSLSLAHSLTLFAHSPWQGRLRCLGISCSLNPQKREFFIDNLQVRIHSIVEVFLVTGLARQRRRLSLHPQPYNLIPQP